MSEKLKIIIFLGSTREGRLAERIGVHVENVVKAQGMEPIIFGKSNTLICLLFRTWPVIKHLP